MLWAGSGGRVVADHIALAHRDPNRVGGSLPRRLCVRAVLSDDGERAGGADARDLELQVGPEALVRPRGDDAIERRGVLIADRARLHIRATRTGSALEKRKGEADPLSASGRRGDTEHAQDDGEYA